MADDFLAQVQTFLDTYYCEGTCDTCDCDWADEKISYYKNLIKAADDDFFGALLQTDDPIEKVKVRLPNALKPKCKNVITTVRKTHAKRQRRLWCAAETMAQTNISRRRNTPLQTPTNTFAHTRNPTHQILRRQNHITHHANNKKIQLVMRRYMHAICTTERTLHTLELF